MCLETVTGRCLLCIISIICYLITVLLYIMIILSQFSLFMHPLICYVPSQVHSYLKGAIVHEK